MTTPHTTARWWKVSGPILLSALSLFITFQIIQPLAIWLDPSYTLLANRSVGKFALSFMVLFQLTLFVLVQSKKFITQVYDATIRPFTSRAFLQPLTTFFIPFFTLHWVVLAGLYFAGVATYNPAWGTFTTSLVLRTLFGLLVTFLLAWSEETIFRGVGYQYIAQYYRPLPSILLASLIFMLAHDIANPLNLLTTNLSLGIGLFLLGVLLNLIFTLTGSLVASMGAHMGLVFVKVILRRAPFLTVAGMYDLRQVPAVHVLFLAVILTLVWINRKKLT